MCVLPWRCGAAAASLYEKWAKDHLPVVQVPTLLSFTPYMLPFWVFETTIVTTVNGKTTQTRVERPANQVREPAADLLTHSRTR